jgi:hypothetical protein
MKRKKKKKAPATRTEPLPETQEPDKQERPGSDDFGGMNFSNFKKNLGCG